MTDVVCVGARMCWYGETAVSEEVLEVISARE